MSRALEAIFRRPIQLLILFVLLPVVSLGIAYLLPRSYQSTASLWALRRYEIIGSTGPESDLLATPGETQATALSELLQTRAFALLVANQTALASTLDASVQSNPQLRDDTLYNDITTHVQVQAQGYNLFTLSYVNRNPKLAQEVVQAVIQVFGAQSQGFTSIEAQNLLENYQTQLMKAKQDAAVAAAAEHQYLAAHPELVNNILRTNPDYATSTDPQYALLHSQTQQAQANVTSIQTNIATINQEITLQGSNANNLFHVIDAPLVPDKAASRLKLFLIGGGIGLGAALLACALYIVILVRRDRTIHNATDLQKVTAYPAIVQIPRLTTTTVLYLAKSSMNGSKVTKQGASRIIK